MERFSDKENLPVILKLKVRTEKVKAPCYLAPPVNPRKKSSFQANSYIYHVGVFLLGPKIVIGKKFLPDMEKRQKLTRCIVDAHALSFESQFNRQIINRLAGAFPALGLAPKMQQHMGRRFYYYES